MFPSKTIHTDGIRAGLMVREYYIIKALSNYRCSPHSVSAKLVVSA